MYLGNGRICYFSARGIVTAREHEASTTMQCQKSRAATPRCSIRKIAAVTYKHEDYRLRQLKKGEILCHRRRRKAIAVIDEHDKGNERVVPRRQYWSRSSSRYVGITFCPCNEGRDRPPCYRMTIEYDAGDGVSAPSRACRRRRYRCLKLSRPRRIWPIDDIAAMGHASCHRSFIFDCASGLA